ncbi:MAG: MAE_28990/MAE_18760 family HEPN-like nuclease [Alphaproteobacteria bacterium]
MGLTVEMLGRHIEADLDWRHEELAVFREILTLDTVTEVRRAALFRGAWALLYAHYEGFCKYALQLLADFLRELPDCIALTHPTFLFMHDKSMKAARSLPIADAYDFFRNTIVVPSCNEGLYFVRFLDDRVATKVKGGQQLDQTCERGGPFIRSPLWVKFR